MATPGANIFRGGNLSWLPYLGIFADISWTIDGGCGGQVQGSLVTLHCFPKLSVQIVSVIVWVPFQHLHATCFVPPGLQVLPCANAVAVLSMSAIIISTFLILVPPLDGVFQLGLCRSRRVTQSASDLAEAAARRAPRNKFELSINVSQLSPSPHCGWYRLCAYGTQSERRINAIWVIFRG